MNQITKTKINTAEIITDNALNNRKKSKKRVFGIFKHLFLILSCTLVLAPIIMILFNSFKTPEEYMYSNVFSIPESFLNFDNFIAVFTKGNMLTGLKNSAILVIGSCALSITMGTMVAYSINRFDFFGNKAIMLLYTLAAVIPSTTTQVATFSLIKGLGLYNTLFSGIILFAGTDLIQIYIYLQFIGNIPTSLDESAMVEGASYFRIFWKIIFPLMMPATITVLVIKVIAVYNDLYIAFLYMPKYKTVSTALYSFSGENNTQWNVMSAAILFALIPTLILYFCMQKYIYSGVTNGAVKE